MKNTKYCISGPLKLKAPTCGMHCYVLGIPIVDILCEHANGCQIGVELKCLHTVKSTYGKGTQGSHCDNGENGHMYGFGNTQEAGHRRVKGARRRGERSDGFFYHATGLGHIPGVDWGEAPRQQQQEADGSAPPRVRPDYRDALLRGHDLRIVIHEVWGAFDDGAVAELDSLARMAKALGDGTDYAAPPGSNAPGAFAVHWARDLGITLHTSIGELLVKSAGIVNSEGAAERAHAIAASGAGRRARGSC